MLLASSAHDLVINLLKMQQLDEDEELAYNDGEVKGEAPVGRPAWMRTMEANTSGWLRLLPPSITPLKRTVETSRTVVQVLEGEVNFRLKLLPVVRLDLEEKEVRVHAAMVITKRGRIVKQPVRSKP